MPASARTALDDWRQFGTGLVGLQAIERGNSLLAFRMDDRRQRIVIDNARRAKASGSSAGRWRMPPHSMALAARLERAGVTVTAEPQTLADTRRVRGLISLGTRPATVSSVSWREIATRRSSRDDRSPLPHRAARPRPRRADGRDIAPVMSFYVDVLGFG